MWYLLAALLLGVFLGLNAPWKIPEIFARYLAVSLLAGVDTSLGGLRASLEGEFDTMIFVSGFIGNTVLAAVFVYLGDILGIELYLAAVVALGVRIFNNLGVIRRHYLRAVTGGKTQEKRHNSD
jgi:small basic protein